MRIFTKTILLVSLSVLLFFTGCNREDSPTPEINPPGKNSVPAFELTNILRGAFMNAGTMDDMTITIEGRACDTVNQVTKITLNNTSVALKDDGDCKTFIAKLFSGWGLNIIDGVAENDLGDKVSLVNSYLRSPGFFPGPGTAVETSAISDAWAGRIGQDVLNDYNRSDFDDFTTVINKVINDYNFYEHFPTIIINNVTTTNHNCLLSPGRSNRQGIMVEKTGPVVLGSISIDNLLAKPGLIEVEFVMFQSSLPLTIRGYSDLSCLPPYEINASTTGSVGFERVNVKGIFDVFLNGDEAEILLRPNSAIVDFHNAFINVNLTGISLIDGLINNVNTLVLEWFEGTFSDIFKDILNFRIGNSIKGIINNFGIDSIRVIPDPINVQLNINSNLDHLEAGDGYIDLGQRARVVPSIFRKDARQLDQGSIIGASTLPSFIGMNGTFGIGMKDDFVNQVLWAAWAGGSFDVKDTNISLITELLNSAGLDATILSIETGLPPVLMPGDNDAEVKIGIGDVLVKSKVNPLLLGQLKSGTDLIELSAYVSLIMTGTFEIDPDTREMSFVQTVKPEVHVQIKDLVLTNESVNLEEKLGIFTSELLKQFFTSVIGIIEIPSFSLGESGGMPPGSKWVLDKSSIYYSSGYHRIVGSVGVKVE